jgi:hypothetical protein
VCARCEPPMLAFPLACAATCSCSSSRSCLSAASPI